MRARVEFLERVRKMSQRHQVGDVFYDSVRRRGSGVKENYHETSEIAEYISMELLANYGDFPGEFCITPASLHDDFTNGVDFVLALEDDNAKHGKPRANFVRGERSVCFLKEVLGSHSLDTHRAVL